MKKIKLSGVLNLIIKTYYSAEKDLSPRQCLLLALLYTTTTNLDSDVKMVPLTETLNFALDEI